MGSQRGELSNLSNHSIVVDDPGASGKEDRRTHIPVEIGIPDDDDAKGCRTPAYLRQLTTPIHQFRYLSSLNSWSTHPAYITGRRQNEINLYILMVLCFSKLQGGIETYFRSSHM